MVKDDGITNPTELALARAIEAEVQAYWERNQLVALLATMFPAYVHRTDIEGWDPEWHGCVTIELPTGQASWHFHDREAEMFSWLPPFKGEWDGHTTPVKYNRIYDLGIMFAEGKLEVAEPLDAAVIAMESAVAAGR